MHTLPDSTTKTTPPRPGAELTPDDFAPLNIPATPEQFAHVVGVFMAGLPANTTVIATRCWWRDDPADREGYLTQAVRAFARGHGDDHSREERAAILEFDGGLPRQQADQVANVRRRRA